MLGAYLDMQDFLLDCPNRSIQRKNLALFRFVAELTASGIIGRMGMPGLTFAESKSQNLQAQR